MHDIIEDPWQNPHTCVRLLFLVGLRSLLVYWRYNKHEISQVLVSLFCLKTTVFVFCFAENYCRGYLLKTTIHTNCPAHKILLGKLRWQMKEFLRIYNINYLVWSQMVQPILVTWIIFLFKITSLSLLESSPLGGLNVTESLESLIKKKMCWCILKHNC